MTVSPKEDLASGVLFLVQYVDGGEDVIALYAIPGATRELGAVGTHHRAGVAGGRLYQTGRDCAGTPALSLRGREAELKKQGCSDVRIP
jgi:hypothetical protein